MIIITNKHNPAHTFIPHELKSTFKHTKNLYTKPLSFSHTLNISLLKTITFNSNTICHNLNIHSNTFPLNNQFEELFPFKYPWSPLICSHWMLKYKHFEMNRTNYDEMKYNVIYQWMERLTAVICSQVYK